MPIDASLKEKGAITGVGETAYTRGSPRSVAGLYFEASLKAIDDAGLKPKDIDGIIAYGSMTVVGDIAQATGALAPDDWADVLRYLPDHKPSRVIGLSVGYRIPAQIMALANQVMLAATPTLRAPTSVRQSDDVPEFVLAEPGDLLVAVAEATRSLTSEITDGTIAVVAPDSMVDGVSQALEAAGIEHGRATRTGLEMGVTVVPVSVVKGLELDGVVVVEPSSIIAEEHQGLRALYVALTRSTRRLTIVHADELPAPMQVSSRPAPTP